MFRTKASGIESESFGIEVYIENPGSYGDGYPACYPSVFACSVINVSGQLFTT